MSLWWQQYPSNRTGRPVAAVSAMGQQPSFRPAILYGSEPIRKATPVVFHQLWTPAERVARHGGSVVNVSVQILRGEVPPGLAPPQGVRLWPGVVVTNNAADGV
jgi:hypothetical protein